MLQSDDIHQKVKTLLREFSKEHGILITEIRADWIDLNTAERRENILNTVTITTKEIVL